MLNKRKRVEDKLERLNIVPIMDAVFIFIFFLLFSAQFVKIFEIETDAPIVSEIPEDKKLEKDPLNLRIKVFEDKLEVLTGIDGVVRDIFFMEDIDFKQKIKALLLELRETHPKDNYAIISPLPSIKYIEIIEVIDLVQTIPEKINLSIIKNKKNIKLSKIFGQIVLEPMDET